jgi:hypothetical protein
MDFAAERYDEDRFDTLHAAQLLAVSTATLKRRWHQAITILREEMARA